MSDGFTSYPGTGAGSGAGEPSGISLSRMGDERGAVGSISDRRSAVLANRTIRGRDFCFIVRELVLVLPGGRGMLAKVSRNSL